LHRLFPEKYAPEVSVFADGKVEIMPKLSYEQAENLARSLKERDLQASVPQHHYSESITIEY
jgi:hypothetical protein